MTVTYLDRIVAAHRAAASTDDRPLGRLLDDASSAPRPRGFAAALAASAPLGVIAEVKRRSPSKGDLAPGLDPAELATQYRLGGAAACSVLTDNEFFGGSAEDLGAVRDAVDLPILRKDFTVSPRDVADARLMGADAVLLIVAALDESELADLHALAVELGLDALVEVHDEAEAERAIDVGATLIGVNQRDLVTFAVDTDRAVRVASRLPPATVRVAESGIAGPEDIGPLVDAGFDAVLVGESLVRSGDPARSVRALLDAAAGGASCS